MAIPQCRFSLLPLVALFLAAPAVADQVRLRESRDEITLSNGLVEATIDQRNGQLTALVHLGEREQVLPRSAYLDWHDGSNHHLSSPAYSVARSPDDTRGELAEIVFRETYAPGGTPHFDVALHYLMRSDESGLYVYVSYAHPSDYGAASIGQSRFVLRVKDELFHTIAVDDERVRRLPPSSTPVEQLGPKESMRFTDGPFEGEITDKYHYFVDAGGHHVHGWAGDDLGCWLISPSTEDHNGGPTKQHNTAHWGRVLLKIITCGHYGASGVRIPADEEWSKLYGPWFIYLNDDNGPEQLWEDAKEKAAEERAAWPYTWVDDPLYPLPAGRGEVSGRIVLDDPAFPALEASGAWVGLAAASPDWQQQSLGYQFWARAGDGGRFELSGVRPGSYTLYAFTRGVIGEFRRDGVEVSAGGSVDLGDLDWQPVHHGRVAWQIGVPDRTAAEFRHGDDHRQWGLWQRFPDDFPDGVSFLVGRSDERTDWNYAHLTAPGPGDAREGTDWTIHFRVPDAPAAGTATLRFAFAGGHNAGLDVLVNGERVGRRSRVGSDNAMIRAGIHGQYSTWDVPFPAERLKDGTNTITLRLLADRSIQQYVMYDCVRLEFDPDA